VELVKEKIDIASFIGKYIKLDGKGKAICPFHKEKTASFSVNKKSGYFYCFGCRTGGDVIKFLEMYKNISFPEALKELSIATGIGLPDFSPEYKKRVMEEREIEDILCRTASFYHKNITPPVEDYLIKTRRLSRDLITKYQIGYANGNLGKYLMGECNFKAELCIKAGVLKKRDDGNVVDFFYKRIIFPNVVRGKVIHISGRSMGSGEPKYLNLPGKISHLYNEDCLQSGNVFITEGIIDCLTLQDQGYNAVAIYGTQNINSSSSSKFSNCSTVYLCMDGDEAGKKAALDIGEILEDKAKIITLPESKDINEYFGSFGKDDFEILIDSAKDILSHKISQIPKDTPKIELPKKLAPILEKLSEKDQAIQEAYLGYEIKERFKLNSRDLKAYQELIKSYQKRESKDSNDNKGGSKKDPGYIAIFEGLVDIVDYEGSPAFLVKDGNKLDIRLDTEIDGKTYNPPPKDQMPWILPRAQEVQGSYELESMLTPEESNTALYNDLLSYHKSISELPGEEYYDLLVCWDLHTYLLESVRYSPMICLFAVPERGKSITGKAMIDVAYRGIWVECLREAYIIRMAKNFMASIFFDVKDLWRKAQKNQCEDILLQRFGKGTKVPRVLYPDKGPFRDTVFFDIFGPTVIGTNEGIHQILETRTIAINMPQSNKDYNGEGSEEKALCLKERLVSFRARNMGNTLPDVKKPAKRRLGDILKPLLQVMLLVNPARKEMFLKLVETLKDQKKLEGLESLEAQLLMTVVTLEEEVRHGFLAIKKITDSLNEDRTEKYKVSYQRVGKVFTALGFKKGRLSDGASAIIWDPKFIDIILEVYGLRQTSVTSETSVTSVEKGKKPDDTDDADESNKLF
jgi:DNA primase catalytic core